MIPPDGAVHAYSFHPGEKPRRYPGLVQLAMRAGFFAGTQRLDSAVQEQELWEWASRIFRVSVEDADARQCWKDAFRSSYDQAAQRTNQHD